MLSLISGISNGAVYGLVGLGLVIIYRSTDVVNFAIGTIALACMYLASSLTGAGLPLALALLAGIAVCALVGVGAREALIRPLGPGALFSALVITMGLSLILEEVTRQIWGGEPRTFPHLVGGDGHDRRHDLRDPAAARHPGRGRGDARGRLPVQADPARRGDARRRRVGRHRDAAGHQPRPRRARRVGARHGLAALGAAMLVPTTGLVIGGFAAVLFRSFAGIFLGGLTSMYGAVVGGVLVGVLDSLAATYVSASLRDTFVFSLVILVLLVRPQGLFGEPSFARV